MKNKLYKFFAIASVFALFACDSEQAGQDVAEVGSTENYPTASFSFDGPTTVNEEDETVLTYTVTFDKPIDRPIDFVLVQTGGDATLHEDFDFVNSSVAAFETSTELQVIIYNDKIFEGTETLTFEIQKGSSLANRYLLNPDNEFPEPISITINNYVWDELAISFAWDKEITVDGEALSTCDFVDLDVFVSDAADFDINDPWSSFNGTDYAASADCPETMTFDFEAWGDGEYILWHEVYFNGFAEEELGELIPVTATFVRPGLDGEWQLTQVDSQALNSDTLGSGALPDGQGGTTNLWGYIAKVTIDNGSFTITDYDGNVIN